MRLTKAEQEKLKKLMWTRWQEEQEVQLENRILMARDEDFYDGIQLTHDEIKEMEERGQPVQVFNEVKRAVDWTAGMQQRSKIDWSVMPRQDEQEEAKSKTAYLKYLSDVNNSQKVQAKAFKDAIIAGVGWMEEGYRDDGEGEPIYIDNVSWRNVWYDHLGVKEDLSDSRHLFVSKYVDEDVAKTYFPKFKNQITGAAALADYEYEYDVSDSMYYNSWSESHRMNRIGNTSEYRRRRVRLVGAWYRTPVAGKYMISDELWQLNNEQYEPKIHEALLEDGLIDIKDSVRNRVFYAIFLDNGNGFSELLHWMPTPYKHNAFGLTPIWCYRRRADGAPYGMVRNAIDPQKDLNKRRSKALHVLSTTRVIFEDGAFDDEDQAAREAARPDAFMKVAKGKMDKVLVQTDRGLAREHLMLADQDSSFIRSSFGITAENMGEQTNASSGVAIRARQNEGITATAEVFGNNADAFKEQGRKLLSLCEQFVTDAKYFRVTGDKEQLKINTGPDNDITARQSLFVVAEQDYRSTVRMAIFEMMMDLVGKISAFDSGVALNLLDLVVEMADVPNSAELVERIRMITGQGEEDEAKIAAKQEEEQKQKQIEEMAIKLEMEGKAAQIENINAKTEKETASTLKTRVDAIQAAINAVPGLQGTSVPALTDELLSYIQTMNQQEVIQ